MSHLIEVDIAQVTEGGGTLLDRLTLMIFPECLVRFLNTVIYKNELILLNLWSLAHFSFGFIFYKFISQNVKHLIMFKIAFEIWEYWAGLPGHPGLTLEL